jgi:hypothetical protein
MLDYLPWRRIVGVEFTFSVLLTSGIEGGEPSASRTCRFIPEKILLGTHCTGDWMCFAVMDLVSYINVSGTAQSILRRTIGWLAGRDLIPGRCRRFFSTLQRSYRLWCPLISLSNRYRGLIPPGQSGRIMKLTLTSI